MSFRIKLDSNLRFTRLSPNLKRSAYLLKNLNFSYRIIYIYLHRAIYIFTSYLVQVSNPFYLFQLYTVIVWLAQQFYDYSCLVIVTTLIAVAVTVCETRKVPIYTFKLFPCMVSYFASFSAANDSIEGKSTGHWSRNKSGSQWNW